MALGKVDFFNLTLFWFSLVYWELITLG